MMEEEQKLIVDNENETIENGSTSNSVIDNIKFYMKQPRLCDWLIVGIVIVSVVLTIIFVLVQFIYNLETHEYLDKKKTKKTIKRKNKMKRVG